MSKIKKRAYISVFDKENIVEFVRELVEKQNYEIVSTGGTFNLLNENGIAVTEVSSVTNYPEMLSGKVKSLHPCVFAGILADTTNPSEMTEIELNNIKSFDIRLHYSKKEDRVQFYRAIRGQVFRRV